MPSNSITSRSRFNTEMLAACAVMTVAFGKIFGANCQTNATSDAAISNATVWPSVSYGQTNDILNTTTSNSTWSGMSELALTGFVAGTIIIFFAALCLYTICVFPYKKCYGYCREINNYNQNNRAERGRGSNVTRNELNYTFVQLLRNENSGLNTEGGEPSHIFFDPMGTELEIDDNSTTEIENPNRERICIVLT